MQPKPPWWLFVAVLIIYINYIKKDIVITDEKSILCTEFAAKELVTFKPIKTDGLPYIFIMDNLKKNESSSFESDSEEQSKCVGRY